MISSANLVDVTTLKYNKLQKFAQNKTINQDLKNVCNDFEAFFVNQLLDISLKSTKVAGQGVGADIIKGLYTQSISQQSSGNLGISEILYNFLSERKND
jgi:Rod binding domain-containing protein